MATGILYRAARRNEHGDPVDADGKVTRFGSESEVGEIHGLVLGGPSWRPDGRDGAVDTTGLVGVPVDQLQPEHGDVLVIDGIKFRVDGPPQWATRGLVETPPRYTWRSISSTAN